MERSNSIYWWLLLAGILLCANIWILYGLNSNPLYAEGDVPAQVRPSLNEAIRQASLLEKREKALRLASLVISRDPFTSALTMNYDKRKVTQKETGNSQNKSTVQNFPLVDGILTVKTFDGKEEYYLLFKGRLVRVGDKVGQFNVKMITADSVILEANERVYDLKFTKNQYEIDLARNAHTEKQKEDNSSYVQ